MQTLNSLELAQGQFEYMQRIRRHIHMHPELGFCEFETSRLVQSELEKMGIPFETVGTGVIASINGGGKHVLGIRADMDALNIQEENDIDYKSQNPGIMHACGHDAHTAILLGTAKLLVDNSDSFNSNVSIRLIFQPAEEGMGGALSMLSHPKLSDLDSIISLHVWSGLDTGLISAEEGARMAAVDRFEVRLLGKSGHASEPHKTVDCIYVGALLVNALQGIVARLSAPLQPVVLSIGTFNSGTGFNIIAGETTLTGTVRTFDENVRLQIAEQFKRITTGLCHAYGAQAEIDYKFCSGVLVNDKTCAERANICIKNILGNHASVSFDKLLGGEDFADYLKHIPGLMAFIGCRNIPEGITAPHHNEHFNIDERSLVYGAAFFIEYLKSMSAIEARG